MLLGLLETGRVPEGWEDRHGTYPEMFEALFRRADPEISVRVWEVIDGVLPEAPDAADAWLIIGSKYGVYDDLPWIEPLKAFLRDARAARVPMIGICFGHQIMAEAFGGRAEKSGKGWGCGVHEYAMGHRPDWVGEASGFSMHAMHQDQVTLLPDDATLIASSPFCENAMVSYGDPEAPDAISIQPHPEFARPYAQELVELRAGELIPPDVSAPAIQSFGKSVVGEEFARWAVAYLRKVTGERAAA